MKSIPLGSVSVRVGGDFAATVSIPLTVASDSDGTTLAIQMAVPDERWHVLQVFHASRGLSGDWRIDEAKSPRPEFHARDVRLDTALAGFRGGNFYSIGLTGSLQNTQDAGVRFDVKAKQRRVALVEWQYRLSKEYCFVMNNLVVATGNQKWVPHSFAGGNKMQAIKKSFRCSNSNKSSISSTTWVARASSKTYGGFYSLGGIKIDARQTNSESHRISYIPKSSKRATLCGSDAKIAYASMVKEMP